VAKVAENEYFGSDGKRFYPSILEVTNLCLKLLPKPLASCSQWGVRHVICLEKLSCFSLDSFWSSSHWTLSFAVSRWVTKTRHLSIQGQIQSKAIIHIKHTDAKGLIPWNLESLRKWLPGNFDSKCLKKSGFYSKYLEGFLAQSPGRPDRDYFPQSSSVVRVIEGLYEWLIEEGDYSSTIACFPERTWKNLPKKMSWLREDQSS